MAYEALNNAGEEGRRMFRYLKDNMTCRLPRWGHEQLSKANAPALQSLYEVAQGFHVALRNACADSALAARAQLCQRWPPMPHVRASWASPYMADRRAFMPT